VNKRHFNSQFSFSYQKSLIAGRSNVINTKSNKIIQLLDGITTLQRSYEATQLIVLMLIVKLSRELNWEMVALTMAKSPHSGVRRRGGTTAP